MRNAKTLKARPTAANIIDVIKNLLLGGMVGTQEELKQALQQQGMSVTQSKVSRLLRKLGAVKITNDRGESIYSLQLESVPPSTETSLARLIIDVVANESIIVIHTNPGSASLIARLLDHRTQELEILGTVAGDDTLFVVPKSTGEIEKTITAVKKRLYSVQQ